MKINTTKLRVGKKNGYAILDAYGHTVAICHGRNRGLVAQQLVSAYNERAEAKARGRQTARFELDTTAKRGDWVFAFFPGAAIIRQPGVLVLAIFWLCWTLYIKLSK